MPTYELTTLMRREASGYIGPPERHIPLPSKIEIHTSYNSWHGYGLWETKVIWTNPDDRNPLLQLHTTLAPDSQDDYIQHDAVVDFYRGKGYEIVEHIKLLTDAELESLEELLKGLQGLDGFGG